MPESRLSGIRQERQDFDSRVRCPPWIRFTRFDCSLVFRGAKSGECIRCISRRLMIGPETLSRIARTRRTRARPRLKSALPAGRALTVREIGALSDLDNITVRIADVASNLAVLGNRFREELGSSTLP